MPRPTDHYTHAQFAPIESDFRGETVQCMHCKNWSGSVKTLSRKKEHLLKCPSYAAWRAAGHGQDLAPPNKYQKRDSAAMGDEGSYDAQFDEFTPRNRTFDVSRYFDEFWDDSSAQKCMRARCKYCGFVRAKNSTRQFEHVQQCNEFLNSNEGQVAVAEGLLNMQPPMDTTFNSSGGGGGGGGRGDIFKGRAPNPTFARPGVNKQRQSAGGAIATPTRQLGPPKQTPSLVNHLLTKHQDALNQATQLPFLSHAGCGTLSSAALQQWLTQQGHMSRSLCTYIGSLIGKIRLTDTRDPSNDTSWRTLDLLVSALNNAKRELDFLRNTHFKYNLQSEPEPAKQATKGFIDLFNGAASPAASLLEGLVVLWAVEYLYCISWQYAANFVQPTAPSSTSYTVPSYLQSTPNQFDPANPYGQPGMNNGLDSLHTSALHEALVPNWTSLGFTKFVDACKSMVDELANAQTTGNGLTELNNCEANFKQAFWLWRQVFPEVTGMGEERDAEYDGRVDGNGGRVDVPIEIPDDEEDEGDEDAPGVESPYGGTGLGVVDAANHAE